MSSVPVVRGGAKKACTVVGAFTVTTHTGARSQPPPNQPMNTEPPVGVAVRVTPEPVLNDSEQSPGQLMPSGTLATDPVPVPWSSTVSVDGGNGSIVMLKFWLASGLIPFVAVTVPVN